ncbi:MAG TPA: hypothetical protein VFP81_06870 [Propionibacteriaceae bacterium]|nr:hypothetical protein [Propionibacteriaceae bacterium]
MRRQGWRFAFDPVLVGRSECEAWVGYYRRDWPRMLAGLLGMVRHGFALGPLGNLKAAWHVLRGCQAWAPFPDNDPEAARHHMARFFRMVNRAGRLSVDPRLAAELEVAWWQAHRALQHDARVTEDDLLAAMVRFYCYVYQSDPADVRRAAELRVHAMALSDSWVAAGCHLDDPTLAKERLALVASYAALREASDRSEISTD